MEEIEDVSREEFEAALKEKGKPAGTPPPGGEPEGLAEKPADYDELLDTLQRTRADFENYRKRMTRERGNWETAALRDFISRLLGALDDMDRALEAGADASDAAAVYNGLALIRDKVWKVFEDKGLAHIEAEGKPFDPAFHEAMFTEESDEFEAPTVLGVLEKGYTLGGQVLRAARVKVSKPTAPAEEDDV
jgi:molecular chaperone GrpE